MTLLRQPLDESSGPAGNPSRPRPADARRTAPFWLAALLAAWAIAALSRVLPYLPTSGGDFEHLHRGAAALVVGASAFAHTELDYPPLVPVLLAPLGLLSLDSARYVWLGLSLAAVLAAMAALWRLAGGDLAAAAAVAVVLALDGSAIPNLALGQTNPLLLLLFAGALLWHHAQPARAAAAVGLAAALKIWPGIVLLSWMHADRVSRFRAGRSAVLTGALLVALPLGVLVVATPPPHLSLSHGFWLGTPAPLNFSAPAAALRASYGWVTGSAMPADWIDGVTASWHLAPERQRLSLLVSLVVLGTGLLGLFARLNRLHRSACGLDTVTLEGPDVACALVALALVAAPISWYHYQLLQLPAFVLALAPAVRERRWVAAATLAATVLALTHHELVAAIVQQAVPAQTPETALYLTGFCLPILGAAWFASRLGVVGRSRRPGGD